MINLEKWWVVVPGKNVERTLPSVIKDIRANGFSKIVFIDDGSTDATFAVAKNLNITVLRHVINRGQGASLKTGFSYILSQNTNNVEGVVTFDSDGQHSAIDAVSLVTAIKHSHVDVALGSRFLKEKNKNTNYTNNQNNNNNNNKDNNNNNNKDNNNNHNNKDNNNNNYNTNNTANDSNIPFFRRFALKFGVIIIYLFYGIWLSDTHNGIRALSRNAIKRIELRSDRMEHASEILEQIRIKRLSFIEVPVTIKYSDDSLRSGQRTFTGGINILLQMIWKKLVK